MVKNRVAATVEELAVPVVSGLGLELVDVEYVREGGQWFLRLFIDKPGGVTLDDCQWVSERLDKILDEADPIPHSYRLEVSSPGIERPLKKPGDFQRFRGRLVRLTTFAPLDGQKRFTGRLLGMREDSVLLAKDGGGEWSIPLAQVASARLVAEF
ncbi:MAG TPA: ribosome maturation factor RimP [Desulfotomaculum sp.]|nr:ribosome maturation factor RimP [Desulfotomaculum sp.]